MMKPGKPKDNSDTLHMRMPCPEANDANTLSFCSNETKKKVGTRWNKYLTVDDCEETTRKNTILAQRKMESDFF